MTKTSCILSRDRFCPHHPWKDRLVIIKLPVNIQDLTLNTTQVAHQLIYRNKKLSQIHTSLCCTSLKDQKEDFKYNFICQNLHFSPSRLGVFAEQWYVVYFWPSSHVWCHMTDWMVLRLAFLTVDMQWVNTRLLSALTLSTPTHS